MKSKITIQDMQNLARKKEGLCLSEEYKTSQTKLEWQCKVGHRWFATPNSLISRHSWCPECANCKKLTITKMQEIAKQKDGFCLSKKYINSKTKLKWKCKNKHVWKAAPYHITSGRWCPYCLQHISEKICRRYFETLFGKKFLYFKSNSLISKKGNRLELDGYNKELGIAFEHNGIQHYIRSNFFHKNKGFEEQQERDTIKKEYCKNNGINLIEIPYTVPLDELDRYIIKKCKEHKITIPEIIPKLELIEITSLKNLKEMRNLAECKGGKCTSNYYINSGTNLMFECKNKHKWKATPANIKKGKWCRICSTKIAADKQRGTIEEMRQIANERNGKCLSIEYFTARIKLTWQCDKKHIWKNTPDNIKRGQWCPYCYGRKSNKVKGDF